MRFLSLVFLAAIALPLGADPAYRLDVGTELRDRNLKVEPSVTGPAGKRVRYEISVRRAAGAGSSNSSQAGGARLDENGYARLASTSVSVQPGEEYDVTVRLFEGDRLVAEDSVRGP
jgi:hypothetical protein